MIKSLLKWVAAVAFGITLVVVTNIWVESGWEGLVLFYDLVTSSKFIP